VGGCVCVGVVVYVRVCVYSYIDGQLSFRIDIMKMNF